MDLRERAPPLPVVAATSMEFVKQERSLSVRSTESSSGGGLPLPSSSSSGHFRLGKRTSFKPPLNKDPIPSASIAGGGDDVTVASTEFTVSSGSSRQDAQDLQSVAGASIRSGGSGGGASGTGSVRSSFNSRQSKTLIRKSSRDSVRLSELTVNKLQFARLGKLYGRDRECKRLQDAWQDVRTASAAAVAANAEPSMMESVSKGLGNGGGGNKKASVRRFVTVAGSSGTGKSTLVDTLKRSVQREGGFFLQGKFPQQMRLSRQSVEPYAAFAAACSDLCETIISLYDTDHPRKDYKFTMAEFREKLDQELGADACVLTRVIPALLQILKFDATGTSSDDAGDSIGYREAHHQFKYAFRRFIRAVSTFGPVVLVIDDLQWADVASMELLETLLTDRESSAFLAIGCYRDDDMYSAMPHLTSIDTLKEASNLDCNLRVDTIPVGNLDVERVNELLVDLLSSAEDEALGLAECVHKKTLGNIFFVIQFLTLLQDSELLVFNFGAMKWTWDLNKVQESTAATENVVSLMKNKMMTLPESVERVLPMMACLGSTFSVSVLELVVNHFAPEWNEAESDSERAVLEQSLESLTVQLLTRCESEGLIESAGSGVVCESYRWVHDKIQEAAFSLITEEDLQDLKLELGRTLYEGFGPDDLEKNLFTVANLLICENPCDDSLPRQQPIQVAKLYLRAGIKTIENSAFEQAAGYLASGIELLPPDHWQSEYDLSLDLFSSAAEADYCIGNFDRMRMYCDVVIRQTNRPLLDKRRVYNVLMDSHAAERRFPEALALARPILAQLGCKFPNWGVTFHVVLGIIRIKSMLKKRTVAEMVSDLPTMQNEEELWMMSMLDKFTTSAYLGKSDLLPLGIFRGLHASLNGGLSLISPVMFSLVALSLSAFVSDYKGGLDFANQAIELLKHVKSSRKIECRVLFVTHGFVIPWLYPMKLSVKPLLTAYETGMIMGDTDSASWAIYFSIDQAFRTGTCLDVVAADCEFYAEQLREVKQLKMQLLHVWQACRNLSGEDPFNGSLSGAVMQQDEFLDEAKHDRAHQFVAIYRLVMYLAFVFGDHQLVYDCIKMTKMDKGAYEKAMPGMASLVTLYAFNGLSMIALYRETQNRKALKLAKKFAAKIKAWALVGVRRLRVLHLVNRMKSVSPLSLPLTFFDCTLAEPERRSLRQPVRCRVRVHERWRAHGQPPVRGRRPVRRAPRLDARPGTGPRALR